MDSLMIEVAEQAPSLAVLFFIVVYFLRHMAARDEVIQTISQECHRVQERTHQVVEENSKMLGEVSVVLRRLNGG